MNRFIIAHLDICLYRDDEYNVAKIKSTVHGRGGMVVLARKSLQLIISEVIKEEHGRDFIHALVLTNSKEEAIVGWYNSPTTSRKYFNEKLTKVMREYNVRCLAGDLNARHPWWCTAHDKQRIGTQLMAIVNDLQDVKLFAPNKPTFEAIKNSVTGGKRSTIDLILSRTDIRDIERIDSYAAQGLDHFPIDFIVGMKVKQMNKPRKITKTFLQSHKLKEVANLYYKIALNRVEETFDRIAEQGEETMQEDATAAFDLMDAEIKKPWMDQANKRKRHTPPH